MPSYIRNGDIEAAPMLEETVLYSPSAKNFCMLNATAAVVWESLAQPTTFEQLAAAIRARFDIDGVADVEGDLRAALRQFTELNMIRQVDS